MLVGYFDDSGTHRDSDIVIVAGVFGTEWQIRSLEGLWEKHVRAPLDGSKRPLRRFHMYECDNSTGEFAGWTRTESDYFCHLLGRSIIDSHVALYGVACARKDWEELVLGDLCPILGDPEGHCIRNCFVKALDWAWAATFDPHMRFVFDDRPSLVRRDAMTAFDAFQKESVRPELVDCTFQSSYAVVPLQAADMIAWELYRHAKDIMVEGISAVPKRRHFKMLATETQSHFQIATRSSIVKIVDFWQNQPKDNLARIRDHFLLFDPDRPDYSALSGAKDS